MNKYCGSEVIIMACSSCNISCDHCYISYTGNRSPSELFEIATTLKDKYDININGAEILTNLEYLKTLSLIGQPFFMSNGKKIYDNPEVLEILKENGITSVSLSYHFGIQNDISPITPEQTEKTLKLIMANGLQTRLLTTITSKNYNRVLEMCNKAKELGVRGIKFTNFLQQGKALDLPSENILSEKQKLEFFKLLIQAREIYDVDELLIERCGSFGVNPFDQNNNFNCTAINDSVVLAPDNNIYPCVFLAKPGYEIGKYIDGNIILDTYYQNNGQECIADNICNGKTKKFLL